MEDILLDHFGAPLLKRIEEINQKEQRTTNHFPIEIMGRLHNIPVITVRIQFPVYRLANGRTKSAQLEYLTLNQDKPRDLFSGDHDSYDAQKAQHEILTELVKEEDLLQSFKNEGMEQVEPIICTKTGVVVNGNRRLCAWRILFYSDKLKYKSFETIQIAVLPDMDERGIADIEKRLQIQKTMRAEYHWHTKALMAKQELDSGARPNEVAKSYGLSKKDLTKLIEARNLAERYLQVINHPNEWSRVGKSYYAFESIVVGGSKILDQSQRELFQKLAFDLITGEDNIEDSPSGRLYTLIKEYAANISAIADEMYKKIQPADPTSDVDDDADLLAGAEEIDVDQSGAISTAIDNGASISHSEIKSVIEVQKTLKDEKEKATFLVGQLAKVSSLLQLVVDNGLHDDTSSDGVEEHLNSIEHKLKQLRSWLSSKR